MYLYWFHGSKIAVKKALCWFTCRLPPYNQHSGQSSLQSNPQSFFMGKFLWVCSPAPLSGGQHAANMRDKLAKCYQPHDQDNHISPVLQPKAGKSLQLPTTTEIHDFTSFIYFSAVKSGKWTSILTQTFTLEYMKSFKSECYFWSRLSSWDIYHMSKYPFKHLYNYYISRKNWFKNWIH